MSVHVPAQELINQWGAKRWPAYAGRTFNLVFEQGSNCSTCGYEASFDVLADGAYVCRVKDFDLVTLLKEVLGEAPVSL